MNFYYSFLTFYLYYLWGEGITVQMLAYRGYSRKVGHVCGINKKEHILANLGQFEDETPIASLKI